MIFNFYKPADITSFGLPKRIVNSKDDWYVFKAKSLFKPFFPRSHFTSMGHGWWYHNETGDYLYCCDDNTILLYSVQKDSEIVIEQIYRFKEQNGGQERNR